MKDGFILFHVLCDWWSPESSDGQVWNAGTRLQRMQAFSYNLCTSATVAILPDSLLVLYVALF